jgi:hypothetical protein
MPTAFERLAREILTIEATGDRARAEAWFAQYEKMPAELKGVLDSARDIPVDIDPVQPFPDIVR